MIPVCPSLNWIGIPKKILWAGNSRLPLDSRLRVSLDWQLRGYLWTRGCGFSLDWQLRGLGLGFLEVYGHYLTYGLLLLLLLPVFSEAGGTQQQPFRKTGKSPLKIPLQTIPTRQHSHIFLPITYVK